MELTDKEIAENRRKRLKECRIEHNLFIEDVAKIVGVGKSSVSRWETGDTGNIKLAILHKLASYYNVNAAWLYGYAVPKEIESDEHKEIKNKIIDLITNASDEELKKIETVVELFLSQMKEGSSK